MHILISLLVLTGLPNGLLIKGLWSYSHGVNRAPDKKWVWPLHFLIYMSALKTTTS